MAYRICNQCSSEFWIRDSKNRPSKFCGRECYEKYASLNPNKGTFQKNHKLNLEYPIGEITVRSMGRNEVSRRFIKISEYEWQHYAMWLWIENFGRVIPGDKVHHLNGIHLDDRIENLIALPKEDHASWHNRWGAQQIPENWINIYMRRYTTAMLGVC